MKLSATDALQNLTSRNISDYLVKTYAQIIGKRSTCGAALSQTGLWGARWWMTGSCESPALVGVSSDYSVESCSAYGATPPSRGRDQRQVSSRAQLHGLSVGLGVGI
uniref:Uncharacterized protein n=1 Tax=Knipowitschia caucasica TaxID=637954 RepID=A0AAV2KD69_KNICA